MADTKFVSHADVVLRQLGTNCAETMAALGDMLVEAVQDKILYGYKDVHGDPPHTEIVVTGRLFDSITAQVRRESQNAYTVVIVAGTPYAVYVHEGTYKLKGRAFITDAAMDNEDKLKAGLSTGLSAGFVDTKA